MMVKSFLYACGLVAAGFWCLYIAAFLADDSWPFFLIIGSVVMAIGGRWLYADVVAPYLDEPPRK